MEKKNEIYLVNNLSEGIPRLTLNLDNMIKNLKHVEINISTVTA